MKNNITLLVKKAKLILVMAILGLIISSYPRQAYMAANDEIKFLQSHGLVGTNLQMMVQARAEGIMVQNRPYIGNGVVDCYGYVRQVWNPIITNGNPHPEDFNKPSYTQSVMRQRINQSNGLPVNDCVSSNWVRITDLNQLKIGDVVGTVQGHHWGFDVHYGLYAGKVGSAHYQYDCGGDGGAYKRRWWSGFKYYYGPTHMLLSMDSDNQPTTDSQNGHWKLL